MIDSSVQRCCETFVFFLLHLVVEVGVLGQPKKTERTKIFVLSKCQIFVNKMFRNNFER